MIREVHIKNFALIDDLTVPFYNGLNIMTGETGAGKSIIIGAMNALGGERISTDVIYTGADFAYVEISFDNLEKTDLLIREYEISKCDFLVLSRKIMSSGRSVYKINGEKVSAKIMKQFFSLLVDIHSQREHHLLLKKDQTDLINLFLDDEAKTLLADYNEYYQELIGINKKLRIDGDLEFSMREADLLSFEIDEILEMSLLENEDKDLEEEFEILNNGKLILDSVYDSINVIEGEDLGVNERFSKVVSSLEKLETFSTELSGMYESSVEIQELLHELNRSLMSFSESFDLDDERLAEIEDRLGEINKLKSKYKSDVNGILILLNEKQERYDYIMNFKKDMEVFEKKKKEIILKLEDIASKLSIKRKETGDKLARKIELVLKDLNLSDCSLDIRVNPSENLNLNGKDVVSIYISTNKNEPFKHIYDIASGGEISRIMLAIKTVISSEVNDFTLVFDEIDSGISGRTAQKVAEKMNDIAGNSQIICITHLAQIAAIGDRHFYISKEDKGDRVSSTINEIKCESVEEEIARLIAGVEINDTTLNAARDMLRQSRNYKKRVENGI